jgi:hypothetical protein
MRINIFHWVSQLAVTPLTPIHGWHASSPVCSGRKSMLIFFGFRRYHTGLINMLSSACGLEKHATRHHDFASTGTACPDRPVLGRSGPVPGRASTKQFAVGATAPTRDKVMIVSVRRSGRLRPDSFLLSFIEELAAGGGRPPRGGLRCCLSGASPRPTGNSLLPISYSQLATLDSKLAALLKI